MESIEDDIRVVRESAQKVFAGSGTDLDQQTALFCARRLREAVEEFLQRCEENDSHSVFVLDSRRLADALFDPQNGLHLAFRTENDFRAENRGNIVQKIVLAGNAFTQSAGKLKEEILNVFHVCVQQFHSGFAPFVDILVDVCLRLFKGERLCSLRCLALSAVGCVFEFFASDVYADLGDTAKNAKILDLFESLFKEVAHGKPPSTLLGEIVALLGKLVLAFPEVLEAQARTLFVHLVNLISANFRTNVDFVVVAASLESLSCLLSAAPELLDMDSAPNFDKSYRVVIFVFIRLSLERPPDLKRYSIAKGGLKLLSTNGHLFKELLATNVQSLFNAIRPLAEHMNTPLRRLAVRSQEVFIQATIDYFFENPSVTRSQLPANVVSIFTWLIQTYFGILENPCSTDHQIAFAVRGIGLLGKPVKILLGEKELEKVLDSLFRLSAKLLPSETHSSQDVVIFVSRFVESYVRIADNLECLSEANKNHLEHLFSAMFRVYPNLHQSQRLAFHQTVAKFLLMLHRKPGSLKAFLGNNIMKCILICCSKPYTTISGTMSSETETIDIRESIPLYTEYYALWRSLISPWWPSSEQVGEEETRYIKEDVFSAFMESSLQMFQTLNLACNSTAGEDADIQDVASLAPCSPDDMNVYLNFVELFSSLLPCAQDNFMAWSTIFFDTMISLSGKHPILSGFHKLIDKGLWICANNGYFDTGKCENQQVLSRYLSNVHVVSQQYEGELLASCLCLLANTTPALVSSDIFIDTIRRGLKLGVEYPKVSRRCVEALLRWFDNYPDSVPDDVQTIIPLLDKLFSSVSRKTETVSVTPAGKSSKKSLSTMFRRASMFDRANDEKMTASMAKLMALIWAKKTRNLAENSDLYAQHAIKADAKDSFGVSLQFEDANITFPLGTIIPRIRDLAENSSDRTVKIASCEAFHSIMLLFIGTIAHSASYEENLFVSAFSTSLRLACSPDSVVGQLFKPFVLQTVHWVCMEEKMKNSALKDILQVLIDGVCSNGDASLRKFAAECIGECISWIARLYGHGNKAKMIEYLGELFSLSIAYALQVDPYKRLGASKALSTIAREMKKESVLVSAFGFELVRTCVLSIRLSGRDHQSFETGKRMHFVLGKVLFLIDRHSAHLREADPQRRGCATGGELCEWILSLLPTDESLCNSACLDALEKLVMFCQQPALQVWLEQNMNMASIPTLENPVKRIGTDVLRAEWLKRFIAFMSFMEWLNKHRVQVQYGKDSPLFRNIDMFLSSYGALFDRTSATAFKETVAELLCKAKSALFSAALSMTMNSVEMNTFLPLNEQLVRSLLESVISPSVFKGITIAKAVANPLLEHSIAMLKAVRKYILVRKDETFAAAFQKVFVDAFSKKSNPLYLVDFSFKEQSDNTQAITDLKLKDLPRGIAALHHCGFVDGHFVKDFDAKYVSFFTFTAVFNNCLQYTTPRQVSLASEFINLASHTHIDPGIVMQSICDMSPVKIEGKDSQTRGQLFYAMFSGQLDLLIYRQYAVFLPLLFKNLNSVASWEAMFAVLRRACLMKQKADAPGVSVTDFVGQFTYMNTWLDQSPSPDRVERVADLMQLLLALDSENLMRAASERVMAFVHSVLTNQLLPLQTKLKALSLLGLVPVDMLAQFDNDLKTFSQMSLPTRTIDVADDSPVMSDFQQAFDALLSLLAQTGSTLVLLLVMPTLRKTVYKNTSRFVEFFTEEIQNKRFSDKTLVDLMACAILFAKHETTPLDLKLDVLFDVVNPILENIGADAFVDLCRSGLKSYIEKINQQFSLAVIKNSRFFTKQNAKSKLENILFERFESWLFISILYSRFDAHAIRTKFNTIYLNGATGNGNEITKCVMRAAHASKTESLDLKNMSCSALDDNIEFGKDVVYLYHQISFAALVSITVCTQTKEAFFSTLLFKDTLEKNESVWDSVIDIGHVYNFPVETSFIVTGLEAPGSSEDGSKKSGSVIDTISAKYLLSTNCSQSADLFESSSLQRLGSVTFLPQKKSRRYLQQLSSDIPLEMDEVNKMFLMPYAMKVLRFVSEHFQGTLDSMPAWETEYLRTFTSPVVHMNVKIFIAKTILNYPDCVARHHDKWMVPLCQLTLDLTEQSEGISYFVRDLCCLLAAWSEGIKGEVFNELINKIAAKSYAAKSAILNGNMSLLKRLVESFRSSFIPNKMILFDFLKDTSDENKKRWLTGIYLADILAKAHLPLFDPVRDVASISDMVLFESLASKLFSPVREVRESCAHVCGLFVSGSERASKFVDCVKDMIAILLETDVPTALSGLKMISRNAPEFASMFSLKLFDIFPSLKEDDSSVLLDIISASAPFIPDLVESIKRAGFFSMLRCGNPVLQQKILSIIHQNKACLRTSSVLEELQKATISGEGKKLYFEVMMHAYEVVSGDRRDEVLLEILKGVQDKNEIGQAVLDFVEAKHIFSSEVMERVLALLERAVCPQTEKHWLGLVSNAVLSACRSKAPFFSHPLAQTTFNPMDIDTNALTYKVSLSVPLFSSHVDMSSRKRAAPETSQVSMSLASDSFFDISFSQVDQGDDQLGDIMEPPAAKRMRNTAGQAVNVMQSKSVKRRFRPQGSLSSIIAYQLRKTKAQVVVEERMRDKIKGHVDMLRTYRQGDIPDIQISPDDLLGPIKKVCFYDAKMAYVVCTELVKRVVDEHGKRTGNNMDGFYSEISRVASLSRDILGAPWISDPLFVGAFAELIRDILQAFPKSVGEFISHATTIGTAAKKSFALYNGIVLLEEMLESCSFVEIDPKDKNECWYQLSILYKLVNEHEFTQGIFSAHISTQSCTKDAIEQEISGNISKALEIFDRSVQLFDDGGPWESGKRPSQQEVRYWEEGRLECLEKLMQWPDLSCNIVSYLCDGDDTTSLSNPELFESFVKNITSLQFKDTYFEKFLISEINIQRPGDFLKDFMEAIGPAALTATENDNAVDLANYWIWKGDTKRATSCIQKGFDIFLDRWQKVHPLSFQTRELMVGNLLCIMQEADSFEHKGSYLSFVKQFSPDIKTLNRIVRFENLVGHSDALFVQAAKIARKMNYLDVAGQYLHKVIDGEDPAFVEQVAKLYHARQQRASSPGERFEFLRKCLSLCDKLIGNGNQSPSILMLHGRAMAEMTIMACHQAIPEEFASAYPDPAEMVNAAYMSLKNVILSEQKEKPSTHLKFCAFCDQIMQEVESEALHCSVDTVSKLAEGFVDSIMVALKSGHHKAHTHVPRIISLLKDHPSTMKPFRQHLPRTPLWVFLPWLPQIISSVDSRAGYEMQKLLESMSREYSAALFFPLKVGREVLGAKVRGMTADMFSRLAATCPNMNDFAAGLELLQNPSLRLKDWITNYRTASSDEDRRKIARDMYEDCFNMENPHFGAMNRKKAREWGNALNAKDRNAFRAFREEGNVSENMLKYLSAFANVTEEERKKSIDSLENYSMWLSKYNKDFEESSGRLELPGQYDSFARVSDSRQYIVSFEKKLRVMSSIRLPKVLRVHSSNCTVRKYLVKGGEDLRLDQRIEQVFRLVNLFFLGDPACAKKGFKMETYSVVPVSSRCGLIEWVDNTKPLKTAIEENYQKIGKAYNERTKWMARYATRGQKHPQLDLYKSVTREESIREMSREYSCVPKDLLKKFILSTAAGPEAFVYLRNRFMESMSSLNIVSYIMGIGDRHNDNFLISSANGSVVGIDFGHAFGSATQVLPIPELMPFRLTRQITSVVSPHDPVILFKGAMQCVLTNLRDNKRILLDTLKIFIDDPIMPWQTFSSRVVAPENAAPGWYARRLMGIVRQKLDLVNPGVITADEIKCSAVAATRPDCVQSIMAVARGHPRETLRGQIGKKCSSVSQQVECLIEQARDPDVLAKTYVGWAPWL